MELLHEAFNIHIKSFRQAFGKKEKLKVAILISGGVDSSVLLDVANVLKDENNLEITSVHVVFKDISKPDEAYELVKDLSDKYSVKQNVIMDVHDKNEHFNKESARKVMKQAGFLDKYDLVLTGHHADDQIETVLFRLFRGTGVEGLKGMTYFSEYHTEKESRIFGKPFLEIRKSVIQDYANRHNVVFVEDETNFDTDIVRNYIRNIIIPRVEEKFTLEGIINSIDNIHDYLEQNKKTSLNIYKGKWFINDFINLPLMNRVYLVKEYLREMHGYNINKNIHNELKRKLADDLSHLKIQLGAGFEIYIDHHMVIVSNIKDKNTQ